MSAVPQRLGSRFLAEWACVSDCRWPCLQHLWHCASWRASWVQRRYLLALPTTKNPGKIRTRSAGWLENLCFLPPCSRWHPVQSMLNLKLVGTLQCFTFCLLKIGQPSSQNVSFITNETRLGKELFAEMGSFGLLATQRLGCYTARMQSL
jgi:hypothetical protein